MVHCPAVALSAVGLGAVLCAPCAGVMALSENGQAPISHVKGKKLIRVASELCSRLLGSPSLADADLPARVKEWQRTGLDGLVFSMASHDRSKACRNMTGQWWHILPRTYEELEPDVRALQSVRD